MKKHITVTTIVSIFFLGPVAAFAQSQSGSEPLVALCDPLMTLQNAEPLDEDGDEEELTQTRRYDQEILEPLTTREQIMNALFEEKWNFETKAPIERFELCSAEPSYIVLWAKLLRETSEGALAPDAEGYMSIKRDGSFEFVYAKRPYLGTWELDGTEMVLNAEWLNGGAPYRAPVERVETPIEAKDSSGNTNIFNEEMYRLGGFRFYRLPTTMKGKQQNCSCESAIN